MFYNFFRCAIKTFASLTRKWNTYALSRIFPPIGIFLSWPRYVKRRERRNKKEKERAFKSTIISARQNRALSTCIFHCPQYKHETDRETKQEGVIKKRNEYDNYQGVVPIVSAHSPPLARGNSRSSSWSSSSVLFAALPVEQPCTRHFAAYPKFAGHSKDSLIYTNDSASHLSSDIAATTRLVIQWLTYIEGTR